MLEMPQLSLIIAKKQQAQNSNFFYAIQFDDVGHMVHFFFFFGWMCDQEWLIKTLGM